MINSSLFERKHAVITLQGEGSRWRRPSISTGRVHRASETPGVCDLVRQGLPDVFLDTLAAGPEFYLHS